MAAGVAASGNRHGERSASAYVMANQEYPIWDICVDDHDDVTSELTRLEAVFRNELFPHILGILERLR